MCISWDISMSQGIKTHPVHLQIQELNDQITRSLFSVTYRKKCDELTAWSIWWVDRNKFQGV